MITAVGDYGSQAQRILKRQTEVPPERPGLQGSQRGPLQERGWRPPTLRSLASNYDEAADTLTDTETGTVTAIGKVGAFVVAEGNQLDQGWRVFVGLEQLPLHVHALWRVPSQKKALVWSFIFAAASVLSTSRSSLILGLVFADKRIRVARSTSPHDPALTPSRPSLATLVWHAQQDSGSQPGYSRAGALRPCSRVDAESQSG